MIAMAKFTDEILNGRRVIRVETEDEFFRYLGQPMECPPGMAEKFGYTDEVSPEELAADPEGRAGVGGAPGAVGGRGVSAGAGVGPFQSLL